MEKAGYRKLFLPTVAVEHHFQEDRLTIKAFMASAQRMATARAIVDDDEEGATQGPSILSLLPQLPGLAARSLTQLARLAFDGQPDAGFMSRYYHFTLWRKRREAATARAVAGGNLRPAR